MRSPYLIEPIGLPHQMILRIEKEVKSKSRNFDSTKVPKVSGQQDNTPTGSPERSSQGNTDACSQNTDVPPSESHALAPDPQEDNF